MKKEGFYSCKVVDKSSDIIVGFIDYKLGSETYLSLLMIDKLYKGQGIGSSIYDLFEAYIRSCNCNILRIDVLINYDSKVLKFWLNKGFEKLENRTLNWNNNELTVIIMKKIL